MEEYLVVFEVIEVDDLIVDEEREFKKVQEEVMEVVEDMDDVDDDEDDDDQN